MPGKHAANCDQVVIFIFLPVCANPSMVAMQHMQKLWVRYSLGSGYISAPEQKLKNLNAIHFLQLLKFKKTRCPLVCQFLLRGCNIVIFEIQEW